MDFKKYSEIKKKIKPLIPTAVFNKTVNSFHLLESVVASARYGFPARSMKFVGVTGTNGKTTTTNMIDEAGYTVGMNSTAMLQVGDKKWENNLKLTTANPFQLQKLLKDMKDADVQWCVMEVASHALIQHRVWGLKFDTAVMTNLTRDHLDYHGTMENYAAAKGKLFEHHPDVMVLNRDDEWFDFYHKYETFNEISYGTTTGSDIQISNVKLYSKGSLIEFKVLGKQETIEVGLQLPGKFNVYNAAAAVAATYGMGIELDVIQGGLESLEAVPGRMEIIDEGQAATVIVDYAHAPDALENVLSTIRMSLQGRLIAVIGADGERDPGKRLDIGRVAAEGCEVVIITDQEPYGDDPAPIRQAVLEGTKQAETDKAVVIKEVPDREEAIKKALGYGKKGDVVLVTGLGSQPYRGMNEGKIDWDDREVVRRALR